jgi:hypothetical protein
VPLLTLALVPAFLAARGAEEAPPAAVRYPDPDAGIDWLPAGKKAQLESAGRFRVYHRFQFSDGLKASGIGFVHRAVDDVRKHYRPVHYDHGTGIVAADVDGDRRADLYFVNQVGGNELWRSLGKGRFENVTAQAGVGLPGRISVTASFADVDNDGDQDLFVTTVRGGNALFLNDGRGRFRDASKQAGLDLVAHSSGATFFDYDKDGLLDLLLCNVGVYTDDEKGPDGEYTGLKDAFAGHLHPGRSEPVALYRNRGGARFEDVAAAIGLAGGGWCGDASFNDLNQDGWPDVYLLNMQGDDHYFESSQGRRFVDKTADYFPKTPWGSMGIKFFDFDGDGRTDLLLTDMHSDMSENIDPDREKLKSRMRWSEELLQGGANNIFGNALYRGVSPGRWEEVSDRLGVENYWPWGVSVADVNADGWEDVFITSGMGYPFRYGINTLLLNDRGEKFLDSEFLLGIEPRPGGRTHVHWFDVDCSTPEGVGLGPCHGQTGLVSVWTPSSSRSSVVFDLDEDGDLDIVTNELHAAPLVLVSDLSERKAIRWLGVELEGTRSNRNGLGATVRVELGDRVLLRHNDGKSGYLSQSVLPLYVGLDDAKRVERITVDWPSGRRQVVTRGLKLNQTIRIREPR